MITFALFAYNQEKYIREAVEGAFSQTYSPLEIILSDDCSDDQTFEIMKEMATHYDGPHKVVLNCSRQNAGLAMHINQLMAMATGELIVVAAGDDISLPHRVSTITESWLKSGKQSGSIYSGYLAINPVGVEGVVGKPSFQASDLSYLFQNPESIWSSGVFGCTHAWTRDVFEIFGELMPRVIYEDRVIPFRSAILGNVSFVAEPLIKYRILPDSLCRSTSSGSRDRITKTAATYRKQRDALINNQQDLETAMEKQLVGSDEYDIIQAVLQKEIERKELYLRLLTSGMLTRLRVAISDGKQFSNGQRFKYLVVALAPWIYGNRTSKLIGKIKNLVNF